jgi:hypothetical protein
MPDPAWTDEYDMGNLPAVNGFTEQDVASPVVTLQTTGNPANRRIEIESSNGDAIFLTSSVPSLDPTVGVTAEAVLSCTGAGDAGFELTFLNAAVLLMVYENSAEVSWPSGPVVPGNSITVATASNAGDVRWRYLFKPDRNIEVYRDEVLIIGPVPVSDPDKPFQRVLFWGEGGGTQIFREMMYWIGGAMVPG